jgi:hypothetical protein
MPVRVLAGNGAALQSLPLMFAFYSPCYKLKLPEDWLLALLILAF